MGKIQSIGVESGFIIIDGPSGPPIRYPISEVLRAIDIPTGLTHNQVKGITLLANLVVVLIRTLIDRDILNDSFLEDGGFDLDGLTYVIEQLGGDYGDPNFNDVEDA